MTAALLDRLKSHVVDDGELLTTYTHKFYKWSDEDLNGSASVAMWRYPGTEGPIDPFVQYIDVSLYLLVGPMNVVAAEGHIRSVVQYLRENYKTANVFTCFPLRSYTGPVYLENKRAMFETLVRCGVQDY